MELQLSESGGSSFKDSSTVRIVQVNNTNADRLLPVSTSDLVSFVAAPVTVSGQATAFQLVQNEENYYHGRIYLRAAGSGWDSSILTSGVSGISTDDSPHVMV